MSFILAKTEQVLTITLLVTPRSFEYISYIPGPECVINGTSSSAFPLDDKQLAQAYIITFSSWDGPHVDKRRNNGVTLVPFPRQTSGINHSLSSERYRYASTLQ